MAYDKKNDTVDEERNTNVGWIIIFANLLSIKIVIAMILVEIMGTLVLKIKNIFCSKKEIKSKKRKNPRIVPMNVILEESK